MGPATCQNLRLPTNSLEEAQSFWQLGIYLGPMQIIGNIPCLCLLSKRRIIQTISWDILHAITKHRSNTIIIVRRNPIQRQRPECFGPTGRQGIAAPSAWRIPSVIRWSSWKLPSAKRMPGRAERLMRTMRSARPTVRMTSCGTMTAWVPRPSAAAERVENPAPASRRQRTVSWGGDLPVGIVQPGAIGVPLRFGGRGHPFLRCVFGHSPVFLTAPRYGVPRRSGPGLTRCDLTVSYRTLRLYHTPTPAAAESDRYGYSPRASTAIAQDCLRL